MTDGTSQGLFIVVAIVIFGIFVVLAYILFEDSLSPAMANMFTTATEQARDKLDNKNLLKIEDMYTYLVNTSSIHGNVSNTNRITYEVDGDWFSGIGIRAYELLEPNKNYALTFSMKELGGEIYSIGGHLDLSTETVIYLNGEKIRNSDYLGNNPFDAGIKLTEKYNELEIYFNTNNIEGDYYYNTPVNNQKPSRVPIHIQPNRMYERVNGKKTLTGFYKPYKVEIKNVKLVEVTE